jgi:hypothetical protein
MDNLFGTALDGKPNLRGPEESPRVITDCTHH